MFVVNIIRAGYNWVLRHKLQALERLQSPLGKPKAAQIKFWKFPHYFNRIRYYQD